MGMLLRAPANLANLPRLTARFVVAGLLLISARSLYATDFYVATSGTGNGTQANPYATIAKAVASGQYTPGSTIFVGAGTYNLSSKLELNKSGATGTSAANSYNIVALSGTPVLDFHTESIGSRGIQIDSDGWNVKGLTVQYAGDNGVYISSSHNTLNQCTIRQSQDTGVAIQSTSAGTPTGSHPGFNLILNCDSYGNYDVANRGENADGFTAKFRSLGPGNVFSGCRSFNNSDDGFDFWGAENGVTVQNCWAFHNAISAKFLGVTGTFNGDGNGIKLGHDSGTHILNNMLIFGNQGSDGNGIDINGNAFADPGSSGIPNNPYIAINHGVTLYNNTIFNNKGSNFHIDENPQDSATNGTPATTHVIVNNVSLKVSGSTVTSGVSIDAGNTENHNSWDSGFGIAQSDFISLADLVVDGTYHPSTDRTGTTAPTYATTSGAAGSVSAVSSRNADGSLPDLKGFLQLVAGDHLIDAGISSFTSGGPPGFTSAVNPSYSGSAPDLGAFETFPLAGDFNRDGHVSAADLAVMLSALSDLSDYQSSHNLQPADLMRIADVNGDGAFSTADLQSLLLRLKSGQGSNTAVPEPSGLTLFAIAALTSSTTLFRNRLSTHS
jgi:hypothetical protein